MIREGGYIKLHRQILSSALWKEKRAFDRRSAWIDILCEVRWHEKPVQEVIGDQVFEVKRGESIKSVNTWAKRWRWDYSKARRFIEMLEKMGQIKRLSAGKTTHLKVCNFDSYQDLQQEHEPILNITRTQDELDPATEEEGEEIQEGKKGEGALPYFLFENFRAAHSDCANIRDIDFFGSLRLYPDADHEECIAAFSRQNGHLTKLTGRPLSILEGYFRVSLVREKDGSEISKKKRAPIVPQRLPVNYETTADRHKRQAESRARNQKPKEDDATE